MTAADLRERLTARYRALPVRDFNPNQPRDPNGKWGDGVGGGDGGGGEYAKAAKTGYGDWSTDDIAKVMAAPKQGSNGKRDDRMLEMWRQQGFTGKPTVVSREEFDALGDDHERVYRGLHDAEDGSGTAAEFTDAFRTGDEPFPGLGMFGNGTYTIADQSVADNYTQGNPAGLLRMALKPDANVVDFYELIGREKTDDIPDDVKEMIGGDPGKWAVALGYDGFRTATTLVVLNRTALVVQEAD